MSRNSGTRRQNKPLITLIGEGITEQYYFKHIRSLNNYRFSLKPYYFGTTSLVDMDRKISAVLEGGGIAICVFDTDVAIRNDSEKKKLNSLHRKYDKKKNVVFCDSLPSIEYWFLLHFLLTNRHFNDAKAVERELRTFIPSFKKTANFLEKEKWVEDLCLDEKLEVAIQRARNFDDAGASYSNIYKAFECFRE
jgi:hypothetical protein